MTEKLTLDVKERLLLQGLLPRQGDFTTLRLVRELREELSFSEEEHKQLFFRNGYRCQSCQLNLVSSTQPKCPQCAQPMQPNGSITWEETQDPQKEFKIGSKMRGVITEALGKLNENQQLTENHLSLYEKFMEEQDADSSGKAKE